MPDFAKRISEAYAVERVDRESAFERLARRVDAAPAPEAKPAKRPKAKAQRREGVGDPLTDFLGSRQGKTLQRELMRGAFSLLRKRL